MCLSERVFFPLFLNLELARFVRILNNQEFENHVRSRTATLTVTLTPEDGDDGRDLNNNAILSIVLIENRVGHGNGSNRAAGIFTDERLVEHVLCDRQFLRAAPAIAFEPRKVINVGSLRKVLELIMYELLVLIEPFVAPSPGVQVDRAFNRRALRNPVINWRSAATIRAKRATTENKKCGKN